MSEAWMSEYRMTEPVNGSVANTTGYLMCVTCGVVLLPSGKYPVGMVNDKLREHELANHAPTKSPTGEWVKGTRSAGTSPPPVSPAEECE